MLGSGHPVAWQRGDSELARPLVLTARRVQCSIFVAGLEAVDAVGMAAVKVAGIEKFRR